MLRSQCWCMLPNQGPSSLSHSHIVQSRYRVPLLQDVRQKRKWPSMSGMVPRLASIRAEHPGPCLPGGSPQGCSHGLASFALWRMSPAQCAVTPADRTGHQVSCLTSLYFLCGEEISRQTADVESQMQCDLPAKTQALGPTVTVPCVCQVQ